MAFCNLKSLSKRIQENLDNTDNGTRIRRDCIQLVHIILRGFILKR